MLGRMSIMSAFLLACLAMSMLMNVLLIYRMDDKAKEPGILRRLRSGTANLFRKGGGGGGSGDQHDPEQGGGAAGSDKTGAAINSTSQDASVAGGVASSAAPEQGNREEYAESASLDRGGVAEEEMLAVANSNGISPDNPLHKWALQHKVVYDPPSASGRKTFFSPLINLREGKGVLTLLPCVPLHACRRIKTVLVLHLALHPKERATLPSPSYSLETWQHGPILWKWNEYFDIYHRSFSRFRNTSPVVLLLGVNTGGDLFMFR